MAAMNGRRVIVGGLVAGVVLVIVDFLFGAVIVGPYVAAHPGAMSAAMMAAGNSAGGTVGAVVKDLLNGLAIVWCYAAIRPRFGAGPRTAMYAAVLAWSFVLAFLAVVYSFGMMSIGFASIFSVMYLIQFLIAGFVGGMLYREEAPTAT
jgi:hypothetical protein